MATDRLERAYVSLQGLALGDALGSQFFVPANRPLLMARTLPPAPWSWTDDTEMACAVVAELAAANGRMNQDRLIARFAEHYDFDRGYGPSTNRFLRRVRDGEDWRRLLDELFDGQGSWGNGGAMRVAPLGAYHAGDPPAAADQAMLSATVTHTHPEAVAGAMAVAVAACLVAGGETSPGPLIDAVVRHVPPGRVHDGLLQARRLLTLRDPRTVADELGNGREVSAQDTVPLHHLGGGHPPARLPSRGLGHRPGRGRHRHHLRHRRRHRRRPPATRRPPEGVDGCRGTPAVVGRAGTDERRQAVRHAHNPRRARRVETVPGALK
ncbi:ADP-ribosylglycohydrolase family protein [Actinomadura alba]|uniref:ADP-ribosylglycohydrolase family protein n=1 Tax=Actinomadura alba TaxID=406431 RepID=UPI001FE418F1